MKLTPDEAVAALHALYAHSSGAFRNKKTADAITYADNTRIVPEWLERMADTRDVWHVFHDGHVHDTVATSERDAINKVRYRIYGAKPEADLPPFLAVCPFFVVLDAIGAKRRAEDRAAPRDLFGKKVVSKADALARLRRMSR